MENTFQSENVNNASAHEKEEIDVKFFATQARIQSSGESRTRAPLPTERIQTEQREYKVPGTDVFSYSKMKKRIPIVNPETKREINMEEKNIRDEIDRGIQQYNEKRKTEKEAQEEKERAEREQNEKARIEKEKKEQKQKTEKDRVEREEKEKIEKEERLRAELEEAKNKRRIEEAKLIELREEEDKLKGQLEKKKQEQEELTKGLLIIKRRISEIQEMVGEDSTDDPVEVVEGYYMISGMEKTKPNEEKKEATLQTQVEIIQYTMDFLKEIEKACDELPALKKYSAKDMELKEDEKRAMGKVQGKKTVEKPFRVESESEKTIKRVHALLNRISEGNINKMKDRILETVTGSRCEKEESVGPLIELIFTKAVEEPGFVTVYAKLCFLICEDYLCGKQGRKGHGNELDKEKHSIIQMIHRKIIDRVQIEYTVKRSWSSARVHGKKDDCETEEEKERRAKLKRRVLGNIRFIGELFMHNMIGTATMNTILKEIASHYKNPDEDEVELFCKLMTVIGERLEFRCSTKKDDVDEYYSKIDSMSKNEKMTKKNRFFLSEVIQLREKNTGRYAEQIKKEKERALHEKEGWSKPGQRGKISDEKKHSTKEKTEERIYETKKSRKDALGAYIREYWRIHNIDEIVEEIAEEIEKKTLSTNEIIHLIILSMVDASDIKIVSFCTELLSILIKNKSITQNDLFDVCKTISKELVSIEIDTPMAFKLFYHFISTAGISVSDLLSAINKTDKDAYEKLEREIKKA